MSRETIWEVNMEYMPAAVCRSLGGLSANGKKEKCTE